MLALAAVASVGFVAVQLRVVVVPTILAMMLVTDIGLAAGAAWVFSLLWSAGQSLGSLTANAGTDITNWLQKGPLGVSATDVSQLVSDSHVGIQWGDCRRLTGGTVLRHHDWRLDSRSFERWRVHRVLIVRERHW